MVGKSNEHRYAVATQDFDLRRTLRTTVASVPLVYLNKVVLLMEPPSPLAMKAAGEVWICHHETKS
jgi:rRNA-processing protein FCF1